MYQSLVTKSKALNELRPNFAEKIQRSVEENYLKPEFNAHRLADELCVSRVQLYRKAKEAQLASPAILIRDRRLKEAYKLLHSGEYCVTAACFDSGFNHLSYFARCFRNKYGMNPSQAVRGN